METLNNVTANAVMLPMSALETARAEVIRLESEMAAAAELASKARIETLLNTMTTLGFSEATVSRVLAAIPEPPAHIVRLNRNGQPQRLLTRRDGSVNTVLSGEGLVAHNLADGTRTLAEIAEIMGTAPRSGMPYNASYVRSWLTSGGNGKRGYIVSYDAAGHVTSHAPSTESAVA